VRPEGSASSRQLSRGFHRHRRWEQPGASRPHPQKGEARQDRYRATSPGGRWARWGSGIRCQSGRRESQGAKDSVETA
jgi:hypothetical protein